MSTGARCLAAALLVAAGALLSACGSGSDDSGPPVNNTPVPRSGISAVFNEIYDNDFDANNANAPYDQFDIMYIAFGHIDPMTHTLDFETSVGKEIELQRLETLEANTAALRAAGKLKLVISLGYGAQETLDDPDQTPLLEAYIDTVAPSIPVFLAQHGLDGFDIDYEDPTFTSEAKFVEVASKIREALGSRYLFTISPNTTDHLDGPALEQYVDYVNAQSYNAKNDRDFSVAEVTTLGVSRSKVIAGADIENVNHYQDDANRVAWAIDQYRTGGLGGIFIWQLKPSTNQYPGGTVLDYATQVRSATLP